MLVTFGAPRDLKFKPTRNNEDCFSLTLHDGQMIFMHEPTQKNWKHAVPKRRKCKAPCVSLSFRKVTTESEDEEPSDDQNKEPERKNAQQNDAPEGQEQTQDWFPFFSSPLFSFLKFIT